MDTQANLGFMYNIGDDISQNYTKVFKYFNLAAEQNIKEAKYYLGFMYAKSYGVKQNLSLAKKYYQKSCVNGLQETLS